MLEDDLAKYEVFDISVPIRETMVTWPGDPKPEIRYVKTIAGGGSSNVSSLAMGAHAGTHVDAPLHFVEGAMTVDRIPLETLVGPATVIDMTGRDVVTAADLQEALIEARPRILFKTDNSQLWSDPAFHEVFCHLDDPAAQTLVESGVKLVGVDYLSVEQYKGRTRRTHHILLEAGVIIVEGLNLAGIEPGDYELTCLPLRLEGMEAAPARAILRRPATG